MRGYSKDPRRVTNTMDLKALINSLYNEIKKDKNVEAVFAPAKFNMRGGANRLFVNMKDGSTAVVKVTITAFSEEEDAN